MLGAILAVVVVGVIILAIVAWGAAKKALGKTVPLHDCYDSIINYAKELNDASGPDSMDRCAALRAAVTGRVRGIDGNDVCTKVLPQLPGADKSPNIPCDAPWQRAIMDQNNCSCASS